MAVYLSKMAATTAGPSWSQVLIINVSDFVLRFVVRPKLTCISPALMYVCTQLIIFY